MESPAASERIAWAAGSRERYPDGSLRGIVLTEEVRALLPCGEFVPAWTHASPRSKYAPSLSFYPSGAVKAARFEKPEELMAPNGDVVTAEKVSFFESGRIKRIFFTDGRLSAFWSERDEAGLLRETTLTLPWGRMTLLAGAAAYHENGLPRSVTLWPTERVNLRAGGRDYPVRQGFSLDSEGNLASLEPAFPVKVETPLGELEAYDPDALGVVADVNSLKFDPRGSVVSLKTMAIIKRSGASPLVIRPFAGPHPLDDRKKVFHPLEVSFRQKIIRVVETGRGKTEGRVFSLDDSLEVVPFTGRALVQISLPDAEGL
jgi:hypothetical protein